MNNFLLLLYFCVFFYVSESESSLSANEMKELTNALCRSCIKKTNISTCFVPECNCNNFGNINETELRVEDLEAPTVFCKEDNLISLTWKPKINYVYFLEIHDEQENINFTAVIRCNYFVFNKLEEHSLYRIRLWAVTSATMTYSKSIFLHVETHRVHRKLLPIPKVFLHNLNLTDFNNYEAVVTWEPSQDLACFYDVIWYGESMHDVNGYNEIEIRNPINSRQAVLKNLNFGNNYTVLVMSTTLDHGEESVKKNFTISTPSCLETYKNISICIPEKPINLRIEESLVRRRGNTKPLFDVKYTWNKPKFLPEYYEAVLVNFVQKLNDTMGKISMNVSGNQTECIFRNVELSYHFQVVLTAWSSAGPSLKLVQHRQITGQQNLLHTSSFSSFDLIYVVISILIVLIIALFVIINHFVVKKVRCSHRSKYFADLERNNFSNENVVYFDPNKKEEIENTDEWELNINFLTIQSIIGEGAFGVVRRGLFCPQGISSKKEVAIKMLRDSPTQDELRQFYQEMEIMKSVPPHPHLVSMVGCITKGTPLLVVEYCIHGDLQTLLRVTWDNICNRLPFLQMNEKSSQQFSNILYDFDHNQIDMYSLQPKDLISFARQIVLGMEHLAQSKVLHRDLATRNVLVCDNKIVKISDFGLSRDVYQDNVYCKTGNGKLPIRWMALESMTHQRYTTQSDVWSFGVLLWEIVTLGATPYPGVLTKDLLTFLQNGNRMEKPQNCSNELYSIMLHCWKTSPKERPTFADLHVLFDELLENVSDYLNMDLTFNEEFA